MSDPTLPLTVTEWEEWGDPRSEPFASVMLAYSPYDNTVPAEERELLAGEPTSGRRQEKDGGALVAQSYNVFRFLMACQSRGRVQTKFNGGLFTQPLRCDERSKGRKVVTQQDDGWWLSHEDDRDWGRRFTYQNQRLLYWPLLMSGDGGLMQPFFDYYFDLLPIRRAITKAWFGHAGAYYRENVEPTGGDLRDFIGRRTETAQLAHSSGRYVVDIGRPGSDRCHAE